MEQNKSSFSLSTNTWPQRFLKKEYLILFVVAIINLLVVFFLIKTPFIVYPEDQDPQSYVDAMKYLQGETVSGDIYIKRILTTPLMLYSTIGMSHLTGGNLYGAELAVNIIFYFLVFFVFYNLAEIIYPRQRTALYASVLFLTNWCLYSFGTTFRADMGGWFFFVLGTYFALRYYYQIEEIHPSPYHPPKVARWRKEKKYFYLAILSSIIGIFFKEYGALPIISLILLILISKITWREKMKDVLLAGGLFAVLPLLYYIYFFLHFHFSYADWYAINARKYNSPQIDAGNYAHSLLLLVKVLGWLYLAGWLIFIGGLWREWQEKNKNRILVLLAILPASLAFLAWPAFTQRLAFILVPWLTLVSGYGLAKIKDKYIIAAILISYVFANYLIALRLIT